MIRRLTISPMDVSNVAAVDAIMDDTLAPRAFPLSRRRRGTWSRARRPAEDDRQANVMWAGSSDALSALGVKSGAEPVRDQLTRVLLGCHATTGTRVVNGPRAERRGEVAATTYELVFAVPQSISWVWAQADTPRLRQEIEQAVLAGAYQAAAYLTGTRPVVAGLTPARGFAAAIALHAVVEKVTAKRGELESPPPLLHAHCNILAMLDDEGRLLTPVDGVFDEDYLMLECGAVGRAKLAERLRNMGFQLETGRGPGGHLFEIVGVPSGLWQDDVWRRAYCGGPLANLMPYRDFPLPL